jgi:hypothetical protein
VSKVLVSRGLVAGLAGTAGAAVLALVFLLGRASAPVPPAQVPAPVPTPTAAPAPAAEAPATTGEPAPAPAIPVAPLAPVAPPMPIARPAATRPDAGASERAAVKAYFAAVERIQPAQTGDPDAVAQQMVGGLAKGDSSGLDGMFQQAQATRARLAAITPPAPCAAFHRESLAVLDGGLEMMQSLKQSLAAPGQGGTALQDLSARATELKARSEALQAQEKALRQRYGG